MNTANSDLQVLRNAMLFSLTRHAWSNRCQVSRDRIQTTGDKKKFNATKQLLVSKALDAVTDELNRVYSWCLDRSMPSTAVRRGVYFVKRDQIAVFEAELARSQKKLAGPEGLIAKFLATYDACREAMRLPAPDGLGDLFNEKDYPTAETLRTSFSISWSWLALSVPDDLPEDVRLRETAKLRDSFLEAQEEIRYALRAGFQEMVAHAIDRLTPEAGGKPKIFRESLVTNFRAFCDTFNARNLMEDAELESLVNQARAVVNGLPRDASEAADTLRQSPDIRATTAAQFAALNTQLGALVIDKPTRKFNFDA